MEKFFIELINANVRAPAFDSSRGVFFSVIVTALIYMFLHILNLFARKTKNERKKHREICGKQALLCTFLLCVSITVWFFRGAVVVDRAREKIFWQTGCV